MNTSNVTIVCPDKKWIVNAVTWFLLAQNANILDLEQHVENNTFFMRLEWENLEKDSKEIFEKKFKQIKDTFWMKINFDNKNIKRLGVFCSKEIHCLWDILLKNSSWELEAEICFVISNSLDPKDLVEKFNIPFYYTPCKKDSFEHEEAQLEIVKKYKTDFLWLARYMKILSENFISWVDQKIINVHHSFLPSFIWAKPYEEAHQRWVKIIWATSHYVIPELDKWPIIEQTTKRISHWFWIDKLKIIWRESEKETFSFALKKHIENKIVTYKNRTIIFD